MILSIKTDYCIQMLKLFNKNILFYKNFIKKILIQIIILQKLINLLIKTDDFIKMITLFSNTDDFTRMINSFSKTDDFYKKL